jgi:hypothetical protein
MGLSNKLLFGLFSLSRSLGWLIGTPKKHKTK